MTSLATITAALLDVRAYLARQAQAEEIRNEATWESGSTREEHEASDALDRLDEVLRELKESAPPQDSERASRTGRHTHILAA
ncbi:hypothetical protein V5F59_08140 [Xanthobacter autotrophicus DSM 431]|uniref:hypothetical protein n=1 Tax=Xanthobacter nonsaccharivorans TaxID=3119912 RepID=UPI003726F1BA